MASLPRAEAEKWGVAAGREGGMGDTGDGGHGMPGAGRVGPLRWPWVHGVFLVWRVKESDMGGGSFSLGTDALQLLQPSAPVTDGEMIKDQSRWYILESWKRVKKMSLSGTEIYKSQHQTDEDYHSLGTSQKSQDSSRYRVVSRFVRSWEWILKSHPGSTNFDVTNKRSSF